MTGLRLMAVDADDLQILSAHCQDAVLRVGDCRFVAAEKRFVMAMNRFAWERADAARGRGFAFPRRAPSFERRRSALHFARVLKVARRGADVADPDAILSLLAIRFLPGEAPSGAVELVFAGGSAIRLDVEVIEAQLTDLGPSWSTAARPDHEAANERG